MKKLVIFFYLSVVLEAFATTYVCTANFQSYMGIPTTDGDFVKKHKPFTKVVDTGTAFRIERCSISFITNLHNCDSYEADRYEIDINPVSNLKIKKFYVFSDQYDIQIFSNLSYIDNNGRGALLIGKCVVLWQSNSIKV